MYKINFEKPIHIHFIGIGGISMSGLAEILLEEGFTVSGSDSKESPLTKKLESEGAIIHYGQCAENISDGIDCVVYTAAINKANPDSNAYTRRAAWTADEKLQDTDRCIRYSWKNYYYIHDLSYFTCSRSGSYNFCRRYSQGNRW